MRFHKIQQKVTFQSYLFNEKKISSRTKAGNIDLSHERPSAVNSLPQGNYCFSVDE